MTRLRRAVATARSAWAGPPTSPGPLPPGVPLLAATDLAVAAGARVVLQGVELAVAPGELVALVGPNGAGKTTLLHALAGDRSPVRGAVAVGGRPVGAWSERELALRRAVLPQQVDVAFPFTVEAVVRMGRVPWAGLHEEDDDDRLVAAALQAADVAHLVDRSVPTLSGGERARVALARVLAQDAPLVLLDEPTAALDLGHQERTLAQVRRRVAAGGGAVVVLHDLHQAARHADRVVLVAGGGVVAAGPPAEVLTASRLTEVYGHPVEVVAHPRSGVPLVLPLDDQSLVR